MESPLISIGDLRRTHSFRSGDKWEKNPQKSGILESRRLDFSEEDADGSKIKENKDLKRKGKKKEVFVCVTADLPRAHIDVGTDSRPQLEEETGSELSGKSELQQLLQKVPEVGAEWTRPQATGLG